MATPPSLTFVTLFSTFLLKTSLMSSKKSVIFFTLRDASPPNLIRAKHTKQNVLDISGGEGRLGIIMFKRLWDGNFHESCSNIFLTFTLRLVQGWMTALSHSFMPTSSSPLCNSTSLQVPCSVEEGLCTEWLNMLGSSRLETKDPLK